MSFTILSDVDICLKPLMPKQLLFIRTKVQGRDMAIPLFGVLEGGSLVSQEVFRTYEVAAIASYLVLAVHDVSVSL